MYYIHFTDEVTEAQGFSVSCKKSYSPGHLGHLLYCIRFKWTLEQQV